MNKNNPSDRAMKCAEALQSEWKIGNSSRFCDDAPDWDSASTEEIARIIDAHYGGPTDSELAELDRMARFDGDQEEMHARADQILCDILRRLGHGKAVDLFDKIDKRYA
jgi:hypothetical protein